MTISDYTEFFKWWVIFGGALYIFTAIAVIFIPNFIYKIQSRMFDIKEETFRTVLYSYIAIFKLLYLLFVLTPYLALLMIA
mgnify:CR=1